MSETLSEEVLRTFGAIGTNIKVMKRHTFFKKITLGIWLISFCLLPSAFCILSAQTLNLNQFGIEEGLPQSSIYTMLQDKDGNIWFGSGGEGIYKYDGKLFVHFSMKQGLNSNTIYSIFLGLE